MQRQAIASTPYSLVVTQSFANLKSIRRLAIAELVLGSLCLIAGIITAVRNASEGRLGYNYYINYGEGIWCGIWIIAAGGAGLHVGGGNISTRNMNTHIALCIVGAIFSTILCVISIYYTTTTMIFMFVIRIILDLLSFTSLILLIVSSSLCCCSAGCCGDQAPGRKMMYFPTKSRDTSVIIHNQGHANQEHHPQMILPEFAVEETWTNNGF